MSDETLPTALESKIEDSKKLLKQDGPVFKHEACDEIISQRLQGVAYRAIAKWLEINYPDNKIAWQTLAVHLSCLDSLVKQTELDKDLDGMPVFMDEVEELSKLVFIQRSRIDDLVRKERTSKVFNYRLSGEVEKQKNLLKELVRLKQSLGKLVRKPHETLNKNFNINVDLTPEEWRVVAQKIMEKRKAKGQEVEIIEVEKEEDELDKIREDQQKRGLLVR